MFVYDVIGDYWGEGVAAKDILQGLQDNPAARSIDVYINSPGGSAFDGVAMYTALARHPAAVTVHVDGAALSAASIVAMAGDRILMAEGAMMMIHEAWVMAVGNAGDLRKEADWLGRLDEQAAKIYADRTGQSIEESAKLQAAETWMTADEAVALGFADEVVTNKKAAACPRIGEVFSRYQNPPPRVAAAMASLSPGTDIPTSDGVFPPPTATADTKEQPMADKDKKNAAGGDASEEVPTPATTPTPAPPSYAEHVKPFLKAFGRDRGARYAADGLTIDEAREAYIEELETSNAALQAQRQDADELTKAAVASAGAPEPAPFKSAPETPAIVVPQGVGPLGGRIFRATMNRKAGLAGGLTIITRPPEMRRPGVPLMADSNWSMADMVTSADANLEPWEIDDLVQSVPFLARLPVATTDGNTYKYTKETTAPTVGFREVNAGRTHSKSGDTIVTATLKLLDASQRQDKALADQWPGGPMGWMSREAARHLKAALFMLEQQVIYGVTSPGDSDGFVGMLASLGTLGGQVINAQGSTADIQSSVYIVNAPFDLRGVHMVFGQDGRINIGDVVEQEVSTTSSLHYTAYTQAILGWATVCIGGAYSMARICNLNDATDSKPLTDDLLGEAVSSFPIDKRQNLMAIMSRRSMRELRESRTATNAVGTPAPTPTDYEGMPLIVVESISNTEAVEA